MNLLSTERLQLRQWTDADYEPWAAMNADPEVMRYFPSPLTRAESDGFLDRERTRIAERGYGWWAVDAVAPGPGGPSGFIGMIGLTEVGFDADFAPATEIGWRLARNAWGYGFATEGARVALRFGFEHLDRSEIVSITAVDNAPSRAVMERIGLAHVADGDFDHPNLAPGDPLRRHVLYRVSRSAWAANP